MNLSAHVTLAEFEHSDAAIRFGIENKMNEFEIERAKELCENVFEPIRAHLNKPIKINSGFRSAVVNKRIGGAKTSQHVLGEAMDLDLHEKGIFEWIIDNIDFDQLIGEFPQSGKAQWFHISYRKGRNRKQVLIGTKRAGKTVYLPYSEAKDLLY